MQYEQATLLEELLPNTQLNFPYFLKIIINLLAELKLRLKKR